MTVASLLLQKPTRNSKAKDHAEELEEHLLIWKGRKIMDLVREAESFKNGLDDPGNEHPKIMQKLPKPDDARTETSKTIARILHSQRSC